MKRKNHRGKWRTSEDKLLQAIGRATMRYFHRKSMVKDAKFWTDIKRAVKCLETWRARQK